MNTTNLMAVQDGGGKLIMMDGTIWLINTSEIHISNSWEPPCIIHISEDSGAKEYDYLIRNMDLDLSVSAKKRR